MYVYSFSIHPNFAMDFVLVCVNVNFKFQMSFLFFSLNFLAHCCQTLQLLLHSPCPNLHPTKLSSTFPLYLNLEDLSQLVPNFYDQGLVTNL
jgi:hypothetical protein